VRFQVPSRGMAKKAVYCNFYFKHPIVIIYKIQRNKLSMKTNYFFIFSEI